MTRAKLFTPLQVGDLSLANRIVIAPMCQYSAEDGCMTDWHLIHLGQLALSGAGAADHRSDSGRRPRGASPLAIVGLYSDAMRSRAGERAGQLRRWSDMPIAIQLAHAGRKASTEVPWKGGARSAPDGRGWQTVAPSAVAFEAGRGRRRRRSTARASRAFARPSPQPPDARPGSESTRSRSMPRTAICCTSSCRRCRTGATTHYGGSLENRMRFPLEVFEAVREAFPAGSAGDRAGFGHRLGRGRLGYRGDDRLRAALKARGCDAIHVSSGGLSPHQEIPVGPSYQVPLARAVKAAISMPVVAVGLITEFDQAEAIIGTGEADMVALARDHSVRSALALARGGPFRRSASKRRTSICAPSRDGSQICSRSRRRIEATARCWPTRSRERTAPPSGRCRFDTGRSGACLQRRPCAQIGRWIEMLLTGDPPWTAQVLRSRASLPNRSSHRQPSFLLSPHLRVIAALPSPADLRPSGHAILEDDWPTSASKFRIEWNGPVHVAEGRSRRDQTAQMRTTGPFGPDRALSVCLGWRDGDVRHGATANSRRSTDAQGREIRRYFDDFRLLAAKRSRNLAHPTIRTCDLCLRRATLYPAETGACGEAGRDCLADCGTRRKARGIHGVARAQPAWEGDGPSPPFLQKAGGWAPFAARL